MRPALDENQLAATDTTRFVEDGARRNCARAATNGACLDESGARCFRSSCAPAVVATIKADTLPDENTGKRRPIPLLPLTITFRGAHVCPAI